MIKAPNYVIVANNKFLEWFKKNEEEEEKEGRQK